MIPLYRPGTSIVHRAPAGVKLIALVIAALLLSLLPQTSGSITAGLLVVCALYVLARLPLRVLAGELWRLRWLVLVLASTVGVFLGPEHAWITTGRVVALLLVAALLTLTTRMTDLLAVLRRTLRPFGRIGVDVDSVAFAISLTITMIPVVAGFAEQVREAQRARGARLGLRWAVPLLVRTLRHADDVGDALIARGAS